jgi:hypothetical protein
MSNKGIAAGLFLTITRRLFRSETVQAAGYAVEHIEKRAHLLPGGLLGLFKHRRDEPLRSPDTFNMWCLMHLQDPYIGQASGHDREYWMSKFE